MEKIIFNSSLPRSGSELLQCILHQNPRIYSSPTSPLLEYQFAARSNLNTAESKCMGDNAQKQSFAGACSGMAKGFYEAITDRPIACDKNRGWQHYYEWVDQWCPNPKMICMIRDLRDVYASFEKTYRKNRHMPIGPDNPSELYGMTVEQRIEHWSKTQPVGLALQRLYDSFQRDVADKCLFVKYEELCASPALTMKRIYSYIEEDYFEHDFNNIKKEVFEIEGIFGPYGDHKIRGSLDCSASGSWRNVFDSNISQKIIDSHYWFYKEFYI